MRPEALAAGSREVIEDRELRHRLAAASAETVKSYSRWR
jgi:hypothetical protein